MDMELLYRCDVQQVLRCSLPASLSLSAQVQREVGELSETFSDPTEEPASLRILSKAAVTCLVFIVSHTVSSVVHVCALVGGEVLLQCVCPEVLRLPHRVGVFWRDREDRTVLDIILSSPYVRFQHHLFRGRVQSFPHACNQGNFSILLKYLQLSDSSSYTCFIPQLKLKETIKLTVSDADQCVSEAQRTPGPSSAGSSFTAGYLHLTTSLTLLIFLLLNP